SRVSIGFSCTDPKIQDIIIPDVLAHGKSYEHGFSKNATVIKFVQSCAVEFRSVFRAPYQKFKILAIPGILAHVARTVEFRSVFHAPSRKFKILAIPDVLAHGKSYEHGFVKKCDGHKLCAKSRAESSFNRFFVHCLGNSKYLPFPTY
ncbi:hypothetical protein GW17_00055741, partial [Ensete ventricosum]